MRKIYSAISVALVVILALTSCNSNEIITTESENTSLSINSNILLSDTSSSNNSSEISTVDNIIDTPKDLKISHFGREENINETMFKVGTTVDSIRFPDTIASMGGYFREAKWSELNQITNLERLEIDSGGEYFILVPKYAGSKITIYDMDLHIDDVPMPIPTIKEILFEKKYTPNDYALLIIADAPDTYASRKIVVEYGGVVAEQYIMHDAAGFENDPQNNMYFNYDGGNHFDYYTLCGLYMFDDMDKIKCDYTLFVPKLYENKLKKEITCSKLKDKIKDQSTIFSSYDFEIVINGYVSKMNYEPNLNYTLVQSDLLPKKSELYSVVDFENGYSEFIYKYDDQWLEIFLERADGISYSTFDDAKYRVIDLISNITITQILPEDVKPTAFNPENIKNLELNIGDKNFRTEPWQDAYINKLDELAKMTSDTRFNGYELYDIENSGIPELFIYTGTCEADSMVEIFKYKDGRVQSVGTFGMGHSALYMYPQENALIIDGGHMGHQRIKKIIFENGEVVSEEEIYNNGDTQEYIRTQDVVPGIKQYWSYAYLVKLPYSQLNILPIYSYTKENTPTNQTSSSDEAHKAITEVLENQRKMYCIGESSFWGWIYLEDFLCNDFINNNKIENHTLTLDSYLWIDLNKDGQEECVVKLKHIADNTTFTLILSYQDSVVYGYTRLYTAREYVGEDGTFYHKNDDYEYAYRFRFYKNNFYAQSVDFDENVKPMDLEQY